MWHLFYYIIMIFHRTDIIIKEIYLRLNMNNFRLIMNNNIVYSINLLSHWLNFLMTSWFIFNISILIFINNLFYDFVSIWFIINISFLRLDDRLDFITLSFWLFLKILFNFRIIMFFYWNWFTYMSFYMIFFLTCQKIYLAYRTIDLFLYDISLSNLKVRLIIIKIMICILLWMFSYRIMNYWLMDEWIWWNMMWLNYSFIYNRILTQRFCLVTRYIRMINWCH